MNKSSVYLAHRVVGKKIGAEIIDKDDIRYDSSEARWYTKGDACDSSDAPIRDGEIVGRMVVVVLVPNSQLDLQIISKDGETILIGCNDNLENMIVPKDVTRIEYTSNCTSLKTVTFEKNSKCESIGSVAFSYCESLTSIMIPASVTSIGNYAFKNCTSLTSIVVDENNTKYDSRDNCNAIIETATNTLIVGCQSTIIPSTVTIIGENAFYGCSSLKSVTIPKNVTSIGGCAFYNCSSLKRVYYGGSREDWNNISIGSGNDDLTDAGRWYYRENYSQIDDGNYWHYDDDNNVVIWS